ncbi:MAG: metallophosphoesterase [Acidobacteria bacterium]|nr:metallophosphoesterase [Acidobacteriota bacterium]
MRTFRRLLGVLLLFLAPLLGQVLRFGAIGDSGTGEPPQMRVAERMRIVNEERHWGFVLMLGDNIYERGDPADFGPKFKDVYAALMRSGAIFHATLGNHDRKDRSKGMAQVGDPAFGYVGGQDEYEFAAGPVVNGKTLARFICLNSDAWKNESRRGQPPLDRLARLEAWLRQSDRFQWNLVFFHNPIQTFVVSKFWRWTGRWGHGPDKNLRGWLVPEFKGKVDVVLSGHNHFYQEIQPQDRIHYFVSGGGAKIRKGAKKHHPQVEFAAEVLHFMDFELSETQLKYAAVSERGEILHSGVVNK